ncbi:sequestosome-1-like, partial [Polistes fuscatus]|uniref:sequestosome-1-like n=1 Tax=Polistes fuscatus TaxID=30207 RepID=UPI001CA8F114
MLSFKAYLTTEGSPKEEEIRRFSVEPREVTKFIFLKDKIQDTFSSLQGKQFTITWKDNEDDHIAISTNEELDAALEEIKHQDSPKLYIIKHEDDQRNVYVQPEEIAGVLHHNILCDGCSKDVKGFRYKCIECPNYNLCFDCESKGVHLEHCMIRIAKPSQLIEGCLGCFFHDKNNLF